MRDTQKLEARVHFTFQGYQTQLFHQREAHFLTSPAAETQARQTMLDTCNIETGHG